MQVLILRTIGLFFPTMVLVAQLAWQRSLRGWYDLIVHESCHADPEVNQL